MNTTVSMFIYSGHPDRVDRYYDANTTQAAEESARTILTMMLEFGDIKKFDDTSHTDENKALYANLSYDEIQALPDYETRHLARGVQYNMFVDSVVAMLAGEKRYRLIHSFDPANPDERALSMMKSKENLSTFYINRHFTDSAVYEELTLVDLLHQEPISLMEVEMQVAVDEETGDEKKYDFYSSHNLRIVTNLPQ